MTVSHQDKIISHVNITVSHQDKIISHVNITVSHQGKTRKTSNLYLYVIHTGNCLSLKEVLTTIEPVGDPYRDACLRPEL